MRVDGDACELLALPRTTYWRNANETMPALSNDGRRRRVNEGRLSPMRFHTGAKYLGGHEHCCAGR